MWEAQVAAPGALLRTSWAAWSMSEPETLTQGSTRPLGSLPRGSLGRAFTSRLPRARSNTGTPRDRAGQGKAARPNPPHTWKGTKQIGRCEERLSWAAKPRNGQRAGRELAGRPAPTAAGPHAWGRPAELKSRPSGGISPPWLCTRTSAPPDTKAPGSWLKQNGCNCWAASPFLLGSLLRSRWQHPGPLEAGAGTQSLRP